jgi:hypothetical protein
MACKLQPSIIPFKAILGGSQSASSTRVTPKIVIEADVKGLTSLLKDDELQQYISALCLMTIDDTERSTQIEVLDVLNGIVRFDIDLFDTMSFNWWDSFTDIWCETYILVDTAQMSEDYNIVIADEYLDMKGEIEKTYIIEGGEINYDLIISDSREAVQSTNASATEEVETCDGETTDVDTPGDYKTAPKIGRTFGSLNKIEGEDSIEEGTLESNTMGEKL